MFADVIELKCRRRELERLGVKARRIRLPLPRMIFVQKHVQGKIRRQLAVQTMQHQFISNIAGAGAVEDMDRFAGRHE